MTQAEMAEQETIQLYTAEECGPCQDVKTAVEEGNFVVLGLEGEVAIETVDLTEGDNYTKVEDLEMEAIPAAYHRLQQCRIFIDEETKRVTFDCRPEGAQESDGQETNS
jgi:glutaredoxin